MSTSIVLFRDAHGFYTIKVNGTDVGFMLTNRDYYPQWYIRLHGEKDRTTHSDKQAALDYLQLRFDGVVSDV